MNTDGSFWATIGAAGLGGIIGVVGTIVTALINRQQPMAALVDARIRLLIEGYERRINELQSEILKLQQKVDALTQELELSRGRAGFDL